MNESVDVLVVGAGLAGTSAACHLRKLCPDKSVAVLEAREASGGTWDLFRYPGVRSDSDMYTLGFSFRPWLGDKAIADGGDILNYIRDTQREHGVDALIRYGHRVVHAEWSSQDARWTVAVDVAGERRSFRCRFLFMCTGYYDYAEGHAPRFEGQDEFKGALLHPQFWPRDFDATGKRIVVIGSGATAVTLVPSLAKTAAHVTMLQRSPTYVVSIPSKDKQALRLRKLLPPMRAYQATRWKHVLQGLGFYTFCRRYPALARRLILSGVRQSTRGKIDLKHFSPRYKPWDQRVCFVPDNDMFDALVAGTASVETDEIQRFTSDGLLLKSGKTLAADAIVTATGLKMKFLGGMTLAVDGQALQSAKLVAYKGTMFGDVPNFAVAIGYTNASWTLKADLASVFVCRLLRYMDEHGYTHARPRLDPTIGEEPILDLSAGYVQRALEFLPRQGSVAPWKLHQNYVKDRRIMERDSVNDGTMRFG